MEFLLFFVILVTIIFLISEFKRINKYNRFLLRKNNALLVLLRNKDLINKEDMRFIDQVVKNEEKPINSYLKNPIEPFLNF
mgnify:CR=1 FL=1